MKPIVPTPFLFRYSFSIPQIENYCDGREFLRELPDEAVIPAPSLLDTDGTSSFVEWRAAWNRDGMAVEIRVSTVASDQPAAAFPSNMDELQIWIDTRNTQSVHRMTRFCHHFSGSVMVSRLKSPMPVVLTRMPSMGAGANDLASAAEVRCVRESFTSGYRYRCWFPEKSLHGYAEEANRRLGFYGTVRDHKRGTAFLAVGAEFPFAHDPSLWVTLELDATDTPATKPVRKRSRR